jgi:hypothetical protein
MCSLRWMGAARDQHQPAFSRAIAVFAVARGVIFGHARE